MIHRNIGLCVVAAVASWVPLSSQAATLAADSLLCESSSSLAFVQRRSELKSLSASEVIKRATATQEIFKRTGQSAIPRRSTTPPDEDGFIGVASACVASDGPVTADVIERKASLGVVKVRTVHQGRQTELWAYASALNE